MSFETQVQHQEKPRSGKKRRAKKVENGNCSDKEQCVGGRQRSDMKGTLPIRAVVVGGCAGVVVTAWATRKKIYSVKVLIVILR